MIDLSLTFKALCSVMIASKSLSCAAAEIKFPITALIVTVYVRNASGISSFQQVRSCAIDLIEKSESFSGIPESIALYKISMASGVRRFSINEYPSG